MKRFLAAAFVVACFAPVALAEDSDRGQGDYEIVKNADGRVLRRIETPEMLRERYLELTKKMVDELSVEELRKQVATLRQQRAKRLEEKGRLADELEKQLADDIRQIGTFAVQSDIGHETKAYAEYLQLRLQQLVQEAKDWSGNNEPMPRFEQVPLRFSPPNRYVPDGGKFLWDK